MKYKLLLLIFSCSVALTSCKKDKIEEPKEDTAVTLKKKLLGNWDLVRGHNEAYDASGNIVLSEDEPGTANQKWEFFENNTAKSYDASGTKTYNYTFSNSNGKNYINLTNNPDEAYQIIIDSSMTWVLEGKANNTMYATFKVTYYFDRK